MTILRLFQKLQKSIQRTPREMSLPQRGLVLDSQTGFRRRDYASYTEYLEHQGRKLQMVGDDIKHFDREYEDVVRKRYITMGDWKGKAVICLAARLGGEVRAFKSMGEVVPLCWTGLRRS